MASSNPVVPFSPGFYLALLLILGGGGIGQEVCESLLGYPGRYLGWFAGSGLALLLYLGVAMAFRPATVTVAGRNAALGSAAWFFLWGAGCYLGARLDGGRGALAAFVALLLLTIAAKRLGWLPQNLLEPTGGHQAPPPGA